MRTLTENGKTFVLVPLVDFERMTRNSEDIADIAAFDAAYEAVVELRKKRLAI